MRMFVRALAVLCVLYIAAIATVHSQSPVGREVAIARHLQDGEEFSIPLRDLLAHGQRLFTAVWTIEEGGGRPLSKGTGAKLSDPTNPLEFPRNFNRVSGAYPQHGRSSRIEVTPDNCLRCGSKAVCHPRRLP